MKTPENREQNPDDPALADEGDIQMWNTPLISCTAQAQKQ
jgi:hypothetical protein